MTRDPDARAPDRSAPRNEQTTAHARPAAAPAQAEGAKVARFFDLQRKKFERCLHVGFDCEKKPIRAHSIQNSIVLDLLQRDNHVIAPLQRIDPETGPKTEFTLVGRNEASTFTGLCDS